MRNAGVPHKGWKSAARKRHRDSDCALVAGAEKFVRSVYPMLSDALVKAVAAKVAKQVAKITDTVTS